ncbi:heterokaryon incompatibility protein-domain-containing protein [Cercophora newfieldiana]|uniref:Heterokaryon incompatibility protein-domain-containing protein n=1 Tax=Cercophora newfieldiana TaxID=92897 RepID=A0AA40CIH2_9PEZI|nr:heterokaryon incompatibility protein-domain-containing protein [Cercophora newfieldiana]
MMASNSICPSCLTAFSHPLPEFRGIPKTDGVVYKCSRAYLRRSACPLCIQIQSLVDKTEKSHGKRLPADSDQLEVRLAHLGASWQPPLPSWADTDPRSHQREHEQLKEVDSRDENWHGLQIWLEPEVYPYGHDDRFSLAADYGTPAAIHISERPRPTDLGTTFDTVKQWIQRCNTHHMSCRAAALTSYHGPFEMPRRLLTFSISEVVPSEVRVERVTTPTCYVALSYCWGNSAEASAQKKSTRDTIAEHERRIPLQSLPQTIQDAILATRELGVGYLWVDALCIIQDDEDDRNHEIARMGIIYANAYCTLSASGATHCDEGFLARPLTEYRDCDYFQIPLRLPAISEPCLVKTSPLGGRNVWVKENGHALLYQGRELLHTRGWTFQETFLSRRLLIYSCLQPYWVCREAVWSCGDPSPVDYLQEVLLIDMFEMRNVTRLGNATIPAKQTDSEAPAGVWRWATIVQRFSSRKLTFVRDKPLAIQAIRETYMQHENVHGYALGLFSTTAHLDLLWHTTYGAPPRSEKLDEFPSWSWMSFDGGVSYPFQYTGTREGGIKRHEQFKILDWPLSDQFGRIVPGTSPLRVAGLVKEVVIPHRFWKDGYASAQDMPCFSLRVLGLQPEEWEDAEDTIGHVTFDQYRMPNSTEDFDENPPSRYKSLECLLVSVEMEDPEEVISVDGKEDAEGYKAWFGLIVGATSTGGYRRIGFCKGESSSLSYFQDASLKEYTLGC